MPDPAIALRPDPAAARLAEGNADFRTPLANPAPDPTHAGEHHLHRMRDDVARATALEPVDADRRHAARGALVEADREVEILGRRPERLLIRVGDHLVFVWLGPD